MDDLRTLRAFFESQLAECQGLAGVGYGSARQYHLGRADAYDEALTAVMEILDRLEVQVDGESPLRTEDLERTAERFGVAYILAGGTEG